jgi:short-subunit dehydrogenase
MTERFAGQVVIITGAGRGIGRAAALAFAEESAHVVLAGRRLDALEVSAREARESGGTASVVQCDVAEDADLRHLVDVTMQERGRIDAVVNNASALVAGALADSDPNDLRRAADVDVWAPMRFAQLVLPHMVAARRGTIVNVSSLAGRLGVPYYAAFSASKYAVRGFSEALRRELTGTGVHVVCVFPGAVADDAVENVEFDRFGFPCVTAEQVGRAIVRGVRLRTPEVFLGIGDSAIAHWNDFLPGTIDAAAGVLRRRFEAAADARKTSRVQAEESAVKATV